MEKKTDFKAMSGKSKVQYIWDYYRWPIVIVVLAAAFIISMIVHYATYKTPILNVIMVNSGDAFSSNDNVFDEFLEKYGYNPATQPVSLSSNLTIYNGTTEAAYGDRQVLTTMVIAGGQDLFFDTGDMFFEYAGQGGFVDLTTVLSDEQLKTYQDELVYYTNEETGEEYLCGLKFTDNDWLTKNNFYDTCYYGIFFSTGHPEISAQFTEFLLTY